MCDQDKNEALVINEVADNMHVFINHFKDNEDYKIVEETDEKVVFEFDSEESGGELLYPFDEWTMFNIDQGDRIEIVKVDTEAETWRRDPNYQHMFWPWRDNSKDSEHIKSFFENVTKAPKDPKDIKFVEQVHETYTSWAAVLGKDTEFIPITDTTIKCEPLTSKPENDTDNDTDN